eukprot:TRINITY_DN2008_c0_g1_i39.p2 TRINITY_DN2008_c0_g1~~TRINITY_DN2008_c0_g1_i39.p2  ORF type:complete len:113 (+),score=12.72 TRINITY_DN2008_c0_g1_i39:488-826(+)
MHSNPSLSGTIPDSLGSLDQLVDLLMHSNPLLSGTVPDSLGSLSQLSLGADLYMYSNPLLSGTLPDSLGSLAHAQQPFAEWHRTRQPRKSLSQLQRLASISLCTCTCTATLR